MASALESEMWKSGHLDTSKIVNFRDNQNVSEELSHSQGDLPVCENRHFVSTTATEAVAGSSIAQNISEELSHVQGDLPVCKTFLFFQPLPRMLLRKIQDSLPNIRVGITPFIISWKQFPK
ncbi:hypothetical protein AVEN_163795-1 [Araneus ventricosus]|uniref:Uncharacterized protein n=1 Tax=Araneus ventricosus TaxID=182803 RepID=A0A4Y2WQ74_ARAVE|nr:hypothetical protein AVEN_147727-1 [Araneus ventricosus]GBO39251.1 hypothetical protein AVEN_163795-1 [Araneus ventricosus]